MALRPHDIQEKDGRRLVVYSRQFTGSVWQINHNLPTDRIFVQCLDEEFNSIFPQRAIKLTDSIFQFEFEEEFSGWASIFHLTPLLKPRRIEFENVTEIDLFHKYGNTDYLHQFWCETPEGYELFYPCIIDKSDPQVCRVVFGKPVTGYVDFAKSFPRERLVQIGDKLWEYRHMSTNAESQNIFIQTTGADEQVFVGDRESRLNDNKAFQTDNIIEVEFDDRQRI
jgi:hypothetical protein